MKLLPDADITFSPVDQETQRLQAFVLHPESAKVVQLLAFPTANGGYAFKGHIHVVGLDSAYCHGRRIMDRDPQPYVFNVAHEYGVVRGALRQGDIMSPAECVEALGMLDPTPYLPNGLTTEVALERMRAKFAGKLQELSLGRSA
ncbi:MAG: hypothetical protein AB7H77_12665 [Bdellovibrionales bacterium]